MSRQSLHHYQEGDNQTEVFKYSGMNRWVVEYRTPTSQDVKEFDNEISARNSAESWLQPPAETPAEIADSTDVPD